METLKNVTDVETGLSRNVPHKPEPKPPGYWLPERYALKLNALEVGYLQALLTKGGAKNFPVNKPGPDGEKITTTMNQRLLEKIVEIVDGGLE